MQSYLLGENGKKFDVDFIRRGMYFGIVSLLTGQPHSRNFQAMNDSLILRIERDRFHALLEVVPQLGLEFSQSLSHRIRRHTRGDSARTIGQIVAVYSPRKGAGSSTYATNLAFSLRRESHKDVILVSFQSGGEPIASTEADAAGAAPVWLRSGPRLGEVVADPARHVASVGRHPSGVALLNVSFDPQDSFAVQQISDFVTLLEQSYQFVVVDLPNEMDEVVLKTLGQSDLVQLVTSVEDEEHFRLTRQVVYRLEELLKENFRPDKVQVLISGIRDRADLVFEEVNAKIDYEVTGKLPHIRVEELAAPFEMRDLRCALPVPESAYARAVTRTARQLSGVQVGLVLGGGAALGLAHIGVLRVLEEEGIPVDVVAGSSMGALIGSLWVTGQDAAGIEAMAREFKNQRALLKLFDPVLPKSGLIAGRLIKQWLSRHHLGIKTFYDTSIPLRIVAYDLLRRQELVLSSGSLVEGGAQEHLHSRDPGTVVEGGQVIIDGGVLNPLPTNVLKEMGINKIIAVNVLQSPGDVSRGLQARRQPLRQAPSLPFRADPVGFVARRLRWKRPDRIAPRDFRYHHQEPVASEICDRPTERPSGQRGDAPGPGRCGLV